MKRKLIIGMLGMLLGAGCQEYEMKEYTLMGRINFIAVDEYGVEYTDPEKMVYEVDFGTMFAMQDTFPITVRAQGNITDYDRKIAFKFVKDSGIKIENLSGHVLPAGEYQHTFNLIVNKPTVADTLFEGELTFDYANSDFLAGVDEQQYYTLECGDMFDPAIYEKAQEWWEFCYFGDYSETKVKFITLALNWTATTWENAWMNAAAYLNDATTALEEYRANPNNLPLLDENTGEWISFPFNPEIISVAESSWMYVEQFFGAVSDAKIQFISETLGWTINEWALSFAYANTDAQKQLIEAYDAYKAAGGEPLIDENTGEEISFPELPLVDPMIVQVAQTYWFDVEAYFGAFSEAKVAFVTNTLGLVYDDWVFAFNLATTENQQLLIDALEAYKADPNNEPLIDENTGDWISFPPVA